MEMEFCLAGCCDLLVYVERANLLMIEINSPSSLYSRPSLEKTHSGGLPRCRGKLSQESKTVAGEQVDG